MLCHIWKALTRVPAMFRDLICNVFHLNIRDLATLEAQQLKSRNAGNRLIILVTCIDVNRCSFRDRAASYQKSITRTMLECLVLTDTLRAFKRKHLSSRHLCTHRLKVFRSADFITLKTHFRALTFSRIMSWPFWNQVQKEYSTRLSERRLKNRCNLLYFSSSTSSSLELLEVSRSCAIAVRMAQSKAEDTGPCICADVAHNIRPF